MRLAGTPAASLRSRMVQLLIIKLSFPLVVPVEIKITPLVDVVMFPSTVAFLILQFVASLINRTDVPDVFVLRISNVLPPVFIPSMVIKSPPLISIRAVEIDPLIVEAMADSVFGRIVNVNPFVVALVF